MHSQKLAVSESKEKAFFFFFPGTMLHLDFLKVFIPQFFEKLVKGKVAQSCPTLCNPKDYT